MHARLSVYELPADRSAEATKSFGEALEQIREARGHQGAYFLLSCDSEKAIALTLWESRADMEASRVTASRVRSEAARVVDASVVAVEEYEVAVDTRASG